MEAAILWEIGQDWSVEEVELDPPREGEVLVSFTSSGLCHSDHHIRAGDLPGLPLPVIGGHEGAGVVEEVGSGVRGLAVGDHVVSSFLPACGRCRPCASGRQHLCDMGLLIMSGAQVDGSYRRHARDRDIGVMSLLGTFASHGTVAEASLIRIDDDIPLESACLLGCGVTTGWGSAVHTAGVQQGDTVVVVGFGGIGCGAVQGARLAGAQHIVVVETVAAKREDALLFGATHFASTMDEATALVGELTQGAMADSAILTVGLLSGGLLGEAVSIVAKGGAVVLTALAPLTEMNPTVPLSMVTLFEKRILGSLFGSASPRVDIPRLLGLYREGKLLLDEMVTTEYKLADINVGYDDMLAGRNIRGVIVHDH